MKVPTGFIMLRINPRNDEGSSILDALVAIILTAALIGGGLWILGTLPRSLGARIQEEQNRFRIMLFVKECRMAAWNIQPDWWSDGPEITQGDELLEIRSNKEEDSPTFILKKDVNGKIILGNGKTERSYEFLAAPSWQLTRDDEDFENGVHLRFEEDIETIVFFGGRVLVSQSTAAQGIMDDQ